MDFTIFKNEVEFVVKQRRNELRDRYIYNFVNTENSAYQEQISSYHKCIDGDCYLGYLWDFLINPVVIEEGYIDKSAKGLNDVYVFWDIHSCERIFIKDYWKFGKDVMLKLNIKTLLQGESYLPEDIYIFDDSLSWTFIKTHEDIQGKRFCLKCGEI